MSEWHKIREEQDKEYDEALKKDQAKEKAANQKLQLTQVM